MKTTKAETSANGSVSEQLNKAARALSLAERFGMMKLDGRLFTDTLRAVFIEELTIDVVGMKQKHPAILVLYGMANDIDSLTESISADAEACAADLMRLSRRVASGSAHESNPLGSSRLSDLPTRLGKLNSLRETFRTVFRMTQDIESFAMFFDHIEDAHAEVRKQQSVGV